MDKRYWKLLPHVILMVNIFTVLYLAAAFIFGYSDLYTVIAIGIAVIYGYKPIVVALGYGFPSWRNEIEESKE